MTILLTLSQLEITGAEVYAIEIAEKLIDRGHTCFIMSDTLSLKTRAKYIPVNFNKRKLWNRIYQIIFLILFIKKNKVQLIHANSRASGWISYFASRICGIPLVTTVHGKLHVHLSSKIVKVFGDYIFAVCENVAKHLQEDFNVPSSKIEVLRNPVSIFQIDVPTSGERKTIGIISSRLTGPKGDVIYQVLDNIVDKVDAEIVVLGAKSIPERFKKFFGKVKFLGQICDFYEFWKAMNQFDVIIGSGRIAIKSIMLGKPTIAIGESEGIGRVTRENIKECLESNFGDIAKERRFDWVKILSDVRQSLNHNEVEQDVREIVLKEYNPVKIFNRIESVYQALIIRKRRREIPILAYHRVVRDKSEAGRHGIFVTVEQFEKHMKFLAKRGFKTITFKDLENVDRTNPNEKYVILTFDDGYEDNYTLAFPILKKYGFKAVIFLVSDLEYNIWDSNFGEPKVKLLNSEQCLEMLDYGIEFGSHGRYHRDLTKLGVYDVEDEVFNSKLTLEERLGVKIISFCYPYGKVNDLVKEIVKKAGYKYGVATDSGPVILHEDFYHIRRILIFPNTTTYRFSRKVRGDYNFKRVGM
jgi:peptidoglycan/xylan/chitin deacetylase (PgdA/CDA1 family)